MMPPATFRPPSTTLPASMTAPVTGSVPPWAGRWLCEGAAVGFDALALARVRGRDADDAWPSDTLVRLAGRRAVVFFAELAGFFAAPVDFAELVVFAELAGFAVVGLAAGDSEVVPSLAPLPAPRFELRRPGRERGRLPITPGSSGLMARNIPSRGVSIPLRPRTRRRPTAARWP